MKTEFFLLILLTAVFCINASAQTTEDLVGTWNYSQKSNEIGEESLFSANDSFEFKKDGSCANHGTISFTIQHEEKGNLSARISYSANGTWNFRDSLIFINFDPKSIKIDVEKDSGMPVQFKMAFGLMRGEMKKEIKNRAPLCITSYSGAEMTLRDSDEKEGKGDLYKRQK